MIAEFNLAELLEYSPACVYCSKQAVTYSVQFLELAAETQRKPVYNMYSGDVVASIASQLYLKASCSLQPVCVACAKTVPLTLSTEQAYSINQKQSQLTMQPMLEGSKRSIRFDKEL